MVKLRKYSSEDINHYIELYTAAFPLEERRPIDIWQNYLNSDITKAFTIIDNDNQFLGFITYWTFSSFTYVEHFAVVENCRGKGIGTSAFQQFLKKLHPLPIILEVEPAMQSQIASQRINFYNKHHFSIVDKPYLQPPYRENDMPVPLTIMTTHPMLVNKNYHIYITELEEKVYNKK